MKRDTLIILAVAAGAFYLMQQQAKKAAEAAAAKTQSPTAAPTGTAPGAGGNLAVSIQGAINNIFDIGRMILQPAPKTN